MNHRKELNRIIHSIKTASGWRPGSERFDARTMASISDNVACLEGRPVKRKILIFRSNGCHWARSAGCSFCGYFVETTGKSGVITARDYVEQFRKAVETIDFDEFPMLCMFTAGSILDDWEFPWEATQEIFRLLGEESRVRKVIIESCAEYVDEAKIARLRDLVGDKIVEVGIGLESADPFVLANCVNKDFTLEQYQTAVTVLRKYFRVLSYIVVKPPFLTEREALDLAVRTGRFAFDSGSTAVSLEPMYIERHTLVDYVYRNGYLYPEAKYRPPWLWTAFEAARRLRHEYGEVEVRIGRSEETPPPDHVARNCDKCSERAMECIDRYAQSYDLRHLDELECSCRRDWQHDLNEPTEALAIPERIERFVGAFQERNVKV